MKRGIPPGFEVWIGFIVMFLSGMWVWLILACSGKGLSEVLPQRLGGLMQGISHGGHLADGVEQAVSRG